MSLSKFSFDYYLDMLPDLSDDGQNELTTLCEAYERALRTGPEELIQQTTKAIIDFVENSQRVKAADDKLACNERRKYSATFLNGAANTVLSAGVATPLVGAMLPGNPLAAQPWLLGEIGGVCIFTAAVLHLAVRKLLGGLRA